MAGTNLDYAKADEQTQKGLDISRQAEWDKWKEFNAAVKFPRHMLQKYLDMGYTVIPLQWVETDKNEHKKRIGEEHLHVPEFKPGW